MDKNFCVDGYKQESSYRKTNISDASTKQLHVNPATPNPLSSCLPALTPLYPTHLTPLSLSPPQRTRQPPPHPLPSSSQLSPAHPHPHLLQLLQIFRQPFNPLNQHPPRINQQHLPLQIHPSGQNQICEIMARYEEVLEAGEAVVVGFCLFDGFGGGGGDGGVRGLHGRC